MKPFYLVAVFLFCGLFSFSQTYNTDVEDIINDVNLDSLTYYLRNLSGEDPVVVNGQTTTIEHRVSNWGNDLAAEYIYETMQGFGYEVTMQDYAANGKNVYAVKEGSLYPDDYYMICAHYDAVDYYCADDNASGTTAVLEAARIFKDLDFEYSIVFALWDEEEIGLIGSYYYANDANNNDQSILGVINMDMISWDGDGDNEFEIHTSFTSNSDDLADYVVQINNIYNLPLEPSIENPGTTASDHASFWSNNFAAILLIEEYYGGDFNPYYHTELDRISILDMEYFHNMSKLSIGTLASLAMPDNTISVEERFANSSLELNCYPNPSNGKTNISVMLKEEGNLKVSLLNSMGQKVKHICDDYQLQGENNFEFNTSELIPGIYLLVASSTKGNATFKLLVQ
ncbi:MAG: hypothetical protein C0598_07150 [Marinilabiliales bacterium]|nr:MAG: hypothetical protein C0598_07150 [Marinilabiliales bacterium]